MNKRKYHNDPEELLSQGKAILDSGEESKYLFRVFAVNMVLSGTSAEKVAKASGVTKAAVTGWVRKADEEGFEALRSKPKSGRPSKLNDKQLNKIGSVLQKNPGIYGFSAWDGPSLSAYINKTYGTDICVRQCQRMLQSSGFSRSQRKSGRECENTLLF